MRPAYLQENLPPANMAIREKYAGRVQAAGREGALLAWWQNNCSDQAYTVILGGCARNK